MDKGAPIGFVLGTVLVVYSIMIDGDIMGFINIPSILIVFGGIIAALMISFPINKVIENAKVFNLIFKESTIKPELLIGQIGELAQAARREGLLVLEEKARDRKSVV